MDAARLAQEFQQLFAQSTTLEGRASRQLASGQSGRVAVVNNSQTVAVQARVWGELRPGQPCLLAQDDQGNWHALPSDGEAKRTRRLLTSYRHALPQQNLRKTYPFKILFIDADANGMFYVGGDRTPELIADLSSYRPSYTIGGAIANTGIDPSNWTGYLRAEGSDILFWTINPSGVSGISIPSQPIANGLQWYGDGFLSTSVNLVEDLSSSNTTVQTTNTDTGYVFIQSSTHQRFLVSIGYNPETGEIVREPASEISYNAEYYRLRTQTKTTTTTTVGVFRQYWIDTRTGVLHTNTVNINSVATLTEFSSNMFFLFVPNNESPPTGIVSSYNYPWRGAWESYTRGLGDGVAYEVFTASGATPLPELPAPYSNYTSSYEASGSVQVSPTIAIALSNSNYIPPELYYAGQTSAYFTQGLDRKAYLGGIQASSFLGAAAQARITLIGQDLYLAALPTDPPANQDFEGFANLYNILANSMPEQVTGMIYSYNPGAFSIRSIGYWPPLIQNAP